MFSQVSYNASLIDHDLIRFLTTKIQDERDVVFEDRRTALLFPGTGQSLVTEEDVKNHKVESHAPGLFCLLVRYL